MVIPSTTNYPIALDNDTNLFLTHDSLRVELSDDYLIGETSITITDPTGIMDKFPPTGIITLTDQCSDAELRAISFFYGSKTSTTFDELELMPGFIDADKPKNRTNVTQNVYAHHHNVLKDSIIAIEEFVGIKGLIDSSPFGETITGRINYLRKLILSPKAFFVANKTIGIAPLTVTFIDESLHTPTSWIWDFGDGSETISSASVSGTNINDLTPVIDGVVPCGKTVVVPDESKTTTHTYFTPNKYDVTLTIGNEFGRDSILFPEFITVRAPAPDEATLTISPTKVKTNQVVNIAVTDSGEQSEDEIVQYTWNLSDDLVHNNASETTALYNIGGIYDVKVRADTALGAYRITTVPNAVNVVESTNLWLLAFDSPSSNLAISKTLKTHEFGLNSETWKTSIMPDLTVVRDHSFTIGYTEEVYQRNLFKRNVLLSQRGSTSSGDKGKAILNWSEDETTIRFKQFEPFTEVWSSATFSVGETATQNWNWLGFSDNTNLYLMLGLDTITDLPSSPESSKTKYNMSNGSSTSTSFESANFINGSDELLYLADNLPATYRSCFWGQNGFFARNDAGPGGFFRIRSFYKTDGVLGDVATNIRKLPDIPGTARAELQIVPLTVGIFVFNNSGEVSAYNPTTNIWSTGGPGAGSTNNFRLLQDASIEGFGDLDQPFIATSDGDRNAYLSFDYSPRAFIKFNEADSTFKSVGSRPTSNEQFTMTVF